MKLPVIVTLLVAMFIAFAGVFMAPETTVMAQVSTPFAPPFPVCSAGTQQVLQFGPGELVRPTNLDDNFNFTVPAGAGPEGEVLVWQGEGHLWDHGCNPGPGNDGGAASCDQDQKDEVIVFTVNGAVVGQFQDHTPDTDNSYSYNFDLNNLVAGSNEIVLSHLNQGTGANSVFYKGIVCAETAPPPPSLEGCTPGFWKNHPAAWTATGYSTSATVESVFDVPDARGLDNNTLLQALNFGGGPGLTGAAKVLLRAAVAALLNAANPDVSYPRTVAEVIADVNAALSSGNRSTMLALATQLDTDNNLGCPLNGKEGALDNSLTGQGEVKVTTSYVLFIPAVRH